MDPINSLDGMAELLRKRIAAEISAKGGIKSTFKPAPPQGQQVLTTEGLRKKIVGLVKSVDSKDPKYDKKIMRIFVENVLAWEFGEGMINDPKFISLVDEVGTTLENEPSVLKVLKDQIL